MTFMNTLNITSNLSYCYTQASQAIDSLKELNVQSIFDGIGVCFGKTVEIAFDVAFWTVISVLAQTGSIIIQPMLHGIHIANFIYFQGFARGEYRRFHIESDFFKGKFDQLQTNLSQIQNDQDKKSIENELEEICKEQRSKLDKQLVSGLFSKIFYSRSTLNAYNIISSAIDVNFLLHSSYIRSSTSMMSSLIKGLMYINTGLAYSDLIHGIFNYYTYLFGALNQTPECIFFYSFIKDVIVDFSIFFDTALTCFLMPEFIPIFAIILFLETFQLGSRIYDLYSDGLPALVIPRRNSEGKFTLEEATFLGWINDMVTKIADFIYYWQNWIYQFFTTDIYEIWKDIKHFGQYWRHVISSIYE